MSESKLIELNFTEKEKENCIRSYISLKMSDVTLEQYIHILNTTDSIDKACSAALFNEYINLAIEAKVNSDNKK